MEQIIGVAKNPEYDYVKGYWSRRFKVGDIGVDIKHINSYTGYNEKHHLVMHPRWGDTHVAFF